MQTQYTAYARNPSFGIEGVQHTNNLREAKRLARKAAAAAGFGWVAEVEEEGMQRRRFVDGRWTV